MVNKSTKYVQIPDQLFAECHFHGGSVLVLSGVSGKVAVSLTVSRFFVKLMFLMLNCSRLLVLYIDASFQKFWRKTDQREHCRFYQNVHLENPCLIPKTEKVENTAISLEFNSFHRFGQDENKD